jgi:hypothetical protein
MDLADGADIATMVGALSVVLGVVTWLLGQWRGWRERHALVELRNWHGYISPEGVNTWQVRLVEVPETPTGRVVLEVVRDDGAPNANWAQNMRQHIQNDGMLARVPTPEEFAFLIEMRKQRGYGQDQGFPLQ